MKKAQLLFFLFCLIVISPSTSFACWGARPLAMGGAFVAVTGDVHGVYWNPAGLATIPSTQFTWTSFFTDLDSINYDDFFALAIPLKSEQHNKYSKNLPQATIGLAMVLDENIRRVEKKPYYRKYTDKYFNFSLGFPLKKEFPLYLGINLKTMYSQIELLPTDNSYFSLDTAPFDSDEVFLVDFALSYQLSPNLNFGILIQNANEPKIFKNSNSNLSIPKKYIMNTRPALSWTPSPSLTITMELYDALGNSQSSDDEETDVTRNLRFGAEKLLTPHLAIRAGAYHINSDNKKLKALTGGLGWKISNFELNYAVMNFYKLDNGYYHMAGLTYTF